MATLVSFHAHPDDEAIACAGTMARAAAEGHRVVLVVATRGEHGEVEDGFLDPGETLGDRRTKETLEAARILGVHRVEFLGYRDSGMIGTTENEAPGCFWQADLDEAAGRLAAILGEEGAEVLTIYDDHGNYGHPDHIQVHRVGLRAAELAGTARVYESTINRDAVMAMMAQVVEEGGELPEDFDPDFDFTQFGSPAAVITTSVDVSPYLEQKRSAMAAHASQIGEGSFFLSMTPEVFAASWGTEWYIRRGAPAGTAEDWLFPR
ncbi:MAG TPA: PIG-L family deacetylase [Acidimicrobiales bacterium]|nr:PIG-L family deacetylase [Acidimicrobiales bacterium]